MNIVVNEELKAYIEPMTPEEYEALERSILAEGCRDALVLWGEILIDGHHRYAICQQHGLSFQTMQHPNFRSMDDVHLWMIDQHLGRRSLSVFQRGELALRKRDILAARRAQARVKLPPLPPIPEHAEVVAGDEPAAIEREASAPETSVEAPPSREAMAKAARLSNAQVGLIEKIRKQAAPEVVEAVKAGTISINAAAAVASLSQDEQRAAASAGDKELKEAARRVRESRRKPKDASGAADEESELLQLRRRVTELTAEVASLRQQLAELQGG
ncbi:plasmid replication/partition related protein [Dyella sp. A6]|uniref:plasmid replication/partition related protein n=1 Tax=Dyella aluminiiresistens TaxID=3069105 RepID=UPI002E76096A|nr:plasmid replication/partition related protein [Dyella sp. A6]